MSTTPYPFAQEIRLGPFTITDPTTGLPVDPATVTLTVKQPDGTPQTLGLVHDGTGVYHCDYLPAAAGHYAYRASSTLPNTAFEGQFDVMQSLVDSDAGQVFGWPGAYLTNAEFKAMPTGVNVDDLIGNGSAAQNDAELANVLIRASRWADNYCTIQLGAHQVLSEHDMVRIGRDGCVRLHPRQTSGNVPPTSCSRVAYGGVGNLTGTVIPTSTWVEDGAMVIPLATGATAWAGPALQFGPPATGAVAVEYDYIAGFPITTFTVAAAASGAAVQVQDATGILPGQRLTIHDPGSEEQVTVSTMWTPTAGPAAVQLAAGTLFDHSIGTGIGAMPEDIKTAVGQIAIVYIRRSSDTGTQAMDQSAGPDMAALEAAAAESLHRYVRVAY